MTIKSIPLWIVICYFAVACSLNQDTYLEQSTLTPIEVLLVGPRSSKDFKLSTVVDSISYIKLDSKYPVGAISKFDFFENRIYVLDSDRTKAIYIFDESGRLINTIAYKGTGPGEFTQPDDFLIDAEQRVVIVYNQRQQKIIHYDLDGGFLSESKIDYVIENMASLGQKKLAFYNHNYRQQEINDRVIIADVNGKISSGYLEYQKKDKSEANDFGMLMVNNLAVFEDSISFTHWPNDTVYHLSADTLLPRYMIDFGDHNIPKNQFKQKTSNEVFHMAYNSPEYAFGINTFCETEDFVLFTYFYKSSAHQVFYNKKSKSLVAPDFLLNDIDGMTFNAPIVTKGNMFVSAIWPSELIDFYNNQSEYPSYRTTDESRKKLEKFIEGVNADDNPILMFTKLKDF